MLDVRVKAIRAGRLSSYSFVLKLIMLHCIYYDELFAYYNALQLVKTILLETLGAALISTLSRPGFYSSSGSREPTPLDNSISNPCKNGGSCVNLKGSYRYDCTQGFTGRHCEQDNLNTADSNDDLKSTKR